MISSSRVLAGAAAIAVLATAGVANAFTVPTFSGTDPSIAAPGYPDFWAANYMASVTANSTQTVYTLSISGSNSNYGIFNFPGGAYAVGNEQIKLTANFDSTGHLLTSLANTYEIDGSLAAWSNPTYGTKPSGVNWTAQPVEKLFSATLTGVTVDSTHEALGFKSTSFGGWANQSQFAGGSTTESLWLYALLGSYKDLSKTSSTQAFTAGPNRGYSDWNAFLSAIKNHQGLMSRNFQGIASIATVPVPAGLWLFGSGLAALGARFNRRKAQQQT